jgi:hypothetical protein
MDAVHFICTFLNVSCEWRAQHYPSQHLSRFRRVEHATTETCYGADSIGGRCRPSARVHAVAGASTVGDRSTTGCKFFIVM